MKKRREGQGLFENEGRMERAKRKGKEKGEQRK